MEQEEAKAIIEEAVAQARIECEWGKGLYSWDGPSQARTTYEFMVEACIVFGEHPQRVLAQYIGAAGWLHKTGMFPDMKQAAAALAKGEYERRLSYPHAPWDGQAWWLSH
jgi:hypothetical protein